MLSRSARQILSVTGITVLSDLGPASCVVSRRPCRGGQKNPIAESIQGIPSGPVRQRKCRREGDAAPLPTPAGMSRTFRNLGMPEGPVIAAAVTASFVAPLGIGPPGRSVTISNYQIVFRLTVALAVVGLLLSLGLKNHRFLADGSRATGPAEAPDAGRSLLEEPVAGAEPPG